MPMVSAWRRACTLQGSCGMSGPAVSSSSRARRFTRRRDRGWNGTQPRTTYHPACRGDLVRVGSWERVIHGVDPFAVVLDSGDIQARLDRSIRNRTFAHARRRIVRVCQSAGRGSGPRQRRGVHGRDAHTRDRDSPGAGRHGRAGDGPRGLRRNDGRRVRRRRRRPRIRPAVAGARKLACPRVTATDPIDAAGGTRSSRPPRWSCCAVQVRRSRRPVRRAADEDGNDAGQVGACTSNRTARCRRTCTRRASRSGSSRSRRPGRARSSAPTCGLPRT